MKNFFENLLTFFVQILMWIGIPLGFIVWQVSKLFTKDNQGFGGLATGLALMLVCGLVTVVGAVLLILLL